MIRIGLLLTLVLALGCTQPAPPGANPTATPSRELTQVQSIVATHIGAPAEEILPSYTFANAGVDGLDFVSIVMKTEERLGVEISAEKLEEITGVEDPKDMPSQLTISQFADVVTQLIEAKKPPESEQEAKDADNPS